MLRRNIENKSDERDELELSRRSFFGRLAIGAVLSIGMPGLVHAAKTEKSKQAKARSAVRIPKKSTPKTAKTSAKTSKVLVKKVSSKSSKVKSSKTQSPQTRLVKASKTVNSNSFHINSRDGRIHSIIRPGQKHPTIQSARGSMSLGGHGRFSSHRSLAFQNPHTGDKLSLIYFEKGRYLTDALAEINFLLRDYRTGDVHAIDPHLLDQLYDLKQMLGLTQPFGVISGYRSPLTNARLHAEQAGVANNSFHIHGRAVDIRLERFDLRRIHNAAIAMHRGGVGYYPESNFIHLDTGTFRTWTL
ncbi:YcbK family protein [Methylomonas methanica]|uniref:Murein endopeptidase K n=1 Tax=Methylomonas methanica (strain DSM 25384 / MC09) TaxID=857087 RepID=F9ZZL3_METMM|nr:YcbK family protein [Methylomonas methanica]AEF98672.1 protein of unknown function DUF882 [Methylomonas methanica MC09]